MPNNLLKFSKEKLQIDKILALVSASSCGAVSIFVGTTRDNFENRRVLKLEYEAYESMAIKVMQEICHDVRSRWKSVENIAIYHRIGEVPVKEPGLIIAISAPHRLDAIAAVDFCINKLKMSVPIWKKEIYAEYDHEPIGVWKENKECPWSKIAAKNVQNVEESK